MKQVIVRERIETRIYEVSFDPQKPPVELVPVVLVPVTGPPSVPTPARQPAATDAGALWSVLSFLVVLPIWLILLVLLLALAFGR